MHTAHNQRNFAQFIMPWCGRADASSPSQMFGKPALSDVNFSTPLHPSCPAHQVVFNIISLSFDSIEHFSSHYWPSGTLFSCLGVLLRRVGSRIVIVYPILWISTQKGRHLNTSARSPETLVAFGWCSIARVEIRYTFVWRNEILLKVFLDRMKWLFRALICFVVSMKSFSWDYVEQFSRNFLKTPQ